MNSPSCIALTVTPGLSLYHAGPPLDLGPLPSLFYFALSGPDSLCLDPYNQPIQFLLGKMIRTFSLTLPAHEAGLSPHTALATWAEDFAHGVNCIGDFLEQALFAVDFAIREKFASPEKICAAGLSRGGFVAAHLTAREERIRYLLAFAPVTSLSNAKEFSLLQHHPLVTSLDLIHIAEALCPRRTRLYIGNRDTRVGTRPCFDFAMALVEKAHEKGIRTPPVDFIMSPSIGQAGHGTSPEIFQQGAEWIAQCLL